MWSWFVDAMRDHPELAIFLTLALGFFIGRLSFKSITLGAVTGTLLAGVLIGQLDIDIPDLVKTVAFIGFLFALGYRVGPQFFAVLRKGGGPQIVVAVAGCLAGLAVAFGMAKIMGYGPGWGAGLLAGGLTQSAVIGVATDAINASSAIPDDQKQAMVNQIPVGYAVCYLVGTAAAAYFLSQVAPRLLGSRGLAAEAHELERRYGVAEEPGITPAYRRLVRRAYRISPGSELDGATVAEEEAEAASRGERIFLHRYRRDGATRFTEPATELHAGDVVTVTADHHDLIAGRMNRVGEEVDDPELLGYEIETLPIVITHKELDGQAPAALTSHPLARNLFISKLVRAGIEVPLGAHTPLHRGDEVTISGPKELVERAATELGKPSRSGDATDYSYVGLGIVLGGLIGIPTVAVAGADIGLTTSGGALIMGLVFGWLRARYPVFGQMPPAANWILNTGGLCTFVGIVGIQSGPDFIDGIASEGLGLVLAGLVVTLLPILATLALGKWWFKWPTPTNLGATAGAFTTTAALGAINDTAKSQVPAISYTVPYAIGNTLLTIWGTVIVALLV